MDGRQELVLIDLSTVNTPHDLQLLLAQSLGFPDFYGCNWNAFWDAITGLVGMPKRLHLFGWAGMVARLPGEAEQLRSCLTDAVAQYPEWSAHVEYD